jgi:valyl-tRNA synthetase
VTEYVARAKKKKIELEKQVQQAKGKLSNENFVKNAPEEVLLEERRRVADFGAQLERLGAVLAQFA